MYLNLHMPLKFFMKRKSLLNLFLLPISLLSVGFLHLNISSLISPPAVRATNWNKYDISKKSGLRNLKNGNYQKAVEFFTEAINNYKGDSDAYYFRGEANQGLGNHKKAIDDFKKSLTMDGIGYEANTNNMIGYSYIQLEDFENALIHLNKAISIKSDQGDYYNNRGEANQGLGNHKKAIDDFKKSLTMDGIGYEANTNNMIGYSYIQLEDFENALIHLNKAISIKSDQGDYYNNRGYVYLNQEKWDEALTDYETAKVKYLKKKENLDEYFYSEIGYIHYNLGSLKLAIDNYDKAIKINPKEGYFYAGKGDALYDLGQENDACANYNKSSELGYEEINDYLNSTDGDWCKK